MADGKVSSVFEREETVAGWDTDYYPPIAERYYDRAVPDMLARMGVGKGDLVLDAGCGPGVHAIRAARYGAAVQAIDFSARMLSHARERAARAGLKDPIRFSEDDLTNLSLATGAFPFVFSWGVVIHIPDADAAIDNLARITAPGGRLALHVLNEASLDFSLEKFVRRMIGKPFKDMEATALGSGLWYEYNGERLWVQRFNTQKLEAAMKRRGLRLAHRRGAEFTEFQRRAPGFLRAPLLLWNSLAYAIKLPPSLFCTHILIFEKAERG